MDKDNANRNSANGGSERRPNRAFKIRLSNDGKYWVFQDITTWVIPFNYLAAIQKVRAAQVNAPGVDAPQGKTKKREK